MGEGRGMLEEGSLVRRASSLRQGRRGGRAGRSEGEPKTGARARGRHAGGRSGDPGISINFKKTASGKRNAQTGKRPRPPASRSPPTATARIDGRLPPNAPLPPAPVLPPKEPLPHESSPFCVLSSRAPHLPLVRRSLAMPASFAPLARAATSALRTSAASSSTSSASSLRSLPALRTLAGRPTASSSVLSARAFSSSPSESPSSSCLGFPRAPRAEFVPSLVRARSIASRPRPPRARHRVRLRLLPLPLCRSAEPCADARPISALRIKITFKEASGRVIRTVEANEGDDILSIAHEHDIDLEGAPAALSLAVHCCKGADRCDFLLPACYRRRVRALVRVLHLPRYPRPGRVRPPARADRRGERHARPRVRPDRHVRPPSLSPLDGGVGPLD